MADSFVQARWYRRGRAGGAKPRLIVVHCTVTRDSATGAEAVARNFAKPDARRGSTHLVADSDSVVRCVKDEDTCYGAGGANTDGLHLELIGQPDQTRAQWLDAFGVAMFRTAAPDIRRWVREFDIPPRWLTVAQLRDKRSRGFTTHYDVEKAFPSTGHWDPGPNFPRDAFMAAVVGQPSDTDPLEETRVIAEVYAMYWLYLRISKEAVDGSPQMRQDVSFHAWQALNGIDGMTLEKKRAQIEAYGRSVGFYPG